MQMHTPALFRFFVFFLLAPSALLAQQPPSVPLALPERVAPNNPPPIVGPVLELDPRVRGSNPPAAAQPVPPAPKTGIMLNFQGASLADVLNYLSEAAGFVIIQDEPLRGTVNVVSRQPVSAEEAVDLVNAVLIEKGFIAIRNGRILKIVSRKGSEKRDLPVNTGADPEKIPRKDEMVTQILPLRYGEAAKLVENLRPLLAENATISANEGANSILMTDTQTNVRRIAQIIKSIDDSVASISTIKVFPLQYANAKELAAVITQLFATNTTGQGGGRQRGGFGGGFNPFGGGGGGPGGGGGGPQPSGTSEARQAASRVVAVADDLSNSVIVSAPDDLIATITEIVEKIDTSITDVTNTRVFRLIHADAVETATLITSLYSDTTTGNQNNRGNRGGNQGQFGGGPGGFGGPGGGNRGQGGQQQSQRALLQSKVVAVGDPRTNSLLVSASRDSMADIAEMIGRLDSTSAKKQQVYVHVLEHADADSVASVLRGMLGDTSANISGGQAGSNRLLERSATGAAMDANALQSGGRGGGGQ